MELQFSWDPKKAADNVRKHGISFAEALTAFADPLSVTVLDPDHSAREERSLLVGLSERRRLLVVAHAEKGTQIRIINARPATRAERETYEED
ncbi:MAG: BrnT family toxin [Gemmatimonadales bacterium]|nr:BrnT family toxin [Gemmatimonadales bacterium]